MNTNIFWANMNTNINIWTSICEQKYAYALHTDPHTNTQTNTHIQTHITIYSLNRPSGLLRENPRI